MEDNSEYGEDLEMSSKNDTFSFKEIILNHLRKILTLSSCEFRGGYYSIISDKSGKDREIYVEDSREKFSNAVMCMAIMLEPKFSDDTKKKYKEFKTKLEALKKEFIDGSTVEEKVILSEGFYSDAKDKILLEQYKQKKLLLFQELLTAISFRLAEMNYLEIGGGSF